MSDQEPREARGERVRREVLGDAHVDAAKARSTPLDAPFQAYITDAAWAGVWGRDGLDRSTRSLVTVALLAALGHERELEMHLRAARNTGATPEQIVEVLLHVGLYAGVPAANTAFAALRAEYGPLATDAEDPAPPTAGGGDAGVDGPGPASDPIRHEEPS